MKILPEDVAKFFIVGVKDFQATRELESFLKQYPVSGLALFNSPFDSPDNVWKDPDVALESLFAFLSKILPKVSFLAVDQEGGRVRRLRDPFVALPAAEKVATWKESDGDLSRVKKVYELAAKQMALSRIRLNFAPVCDLRTSQSSNVVGDRSYGGDVETVFSFVKVFCEAFESNGVATTLKHFPGHGPTTYDSHERIAEIFKEKRDFLVEDFPIFPKAAPFASAVMTAHIAFQEEPDRIFSLDPKLIEEWKAKMPSNLAWITDDLAQMKAVSELLPWRRAFDCGYDFVNVCGTLDQAATAIDDSIRYLEEKVVHFSEREKFEKQSKKSSERLKSEAFLKPLPKFQDWKQSLLEYQSKAKELLDV